MKLRDVLNEKISSDDIDDIMNDTGILPSQLKALSTALITIIDAYYIMTKLAISENKNWKDEHNIAKKLKSMVSKSGLTQVTTNTIDANQLKSLLTYLRTMEAKG